jgi:hypothetical protein
LQKGCRKPIGIDIAAGELYVVRRRHRRVAVCFSLRAGAVPGVASTVGACGLPKKKRKKKTKEKKKKKKKKKKIKKKKNH